MKNNYLSAQRLFVLLILLVGFKPANAQTGAVISSSASTADATAVLDIQSTTKGLLIPRVSLTSTTDVVTVPSPATSLMVYNTNASVTGGSGLGFYYWNGTAWQFVATGGITGGGTANNGTRWTGTTAIGNSVIIDDGTNVGIGVTPTAKLQVGGTSGVDGIKFPDGNLQKKAAKFIKSYVVTTGTTAQTVASTTPQIVTGLSVTLTPSSSSSKFLITAVVNGSRTHVNSVLIYKSVGGGAATSLLSHTGNTNEPGAQVTTYDQGNDNQPSSMGLSAIRYLDAPATAASITYDVRVTSGWAGTTYTTYVNDRNTNDMRTPSTLTILEFAY